MQAQNLTELSTPFPRSSGAEIKAGVDAFAKSLIEDTGAIDLIKGRLMKMKLKKNAKIQAQAFLQFQMKEGGQSFSSAKEFMASFRVPFSSSKVDAKCWTIAKRYARAIIDLKHQVIKEPKAVHRTGKIDGATRKMVHNMVESSNWHNGLPELRCLASNYNRHGRAVLTIKIW